MMPKLIFLIMLEFIPMKLAKRNTKILNLSHFLIWFIYLYRPCLRYLAELSTDFQNSHYSSTPLTNHGWLNHRSCLRHCLIIVSPLVVRQFTPKYQNDARCNLGRMPSQIKSFTLPYGLAGWIRILLFFYHHSFKIIESI